MDENAKKKRVRDDSDIESVEVKRIKDELLNVLEDSDPSPTTRDLETVVKSFQREIVVSSSSPAPEMAEYGGYQPEFGYLLEASDDDLGLPPSSTMNSWREECEGEVGRVNELERFNSDESVGIGELWGFEDQIPSYDSLEFHVFEGSNDNNETVVYYDDVLFDHYDTFS